MKNSPSSPFVAFTLDKDQRARLELARKRLGYAALDVLAKDLVVIGLAQLDQAFIPVSRLETALAARRRVSRQFGAS